MPLRLDVTFIARRYDAGGGDDPRQPEWPPHPARVIAAMRAVAEEADLAALTQLEQLAPPIIHASTASFSETRGYVVTNARENHGKHQTHPARTSGFRQRVVSFPVGDHVQFDWLDADGISDVTVKRLDQLAGRVPYLGRSTSLAMLSVSKVDHASPMHGLSTWQPCSGVGDVSVRVPYPGLLNELGALYELDQPAWQALTTGRAYCQYRLTHTRAPDVPQQTVASPYPDLVILRFVGEQPPGRLVTTFTQALRRKVMGQTQHPLPPALHGHGLPGVPHVAYLGLPFAGFEHADGRLMAVAVGIPGLERDERRRILRGVLGADPHEPIMLTVPGFRRRFELRYAPDQPLPFSATEARWMRPSHQWVTVTPVVLDSFPKDGDLETAVSNSFAKEGLPTPSSVEISKEPLAPGAVRLRPDELPRRCRGRLYRHVRVAFEHKVTGPLLVGAGRYFGVGLFAPESLGGSL